MLDMGITWETNSKVSQIKTLTSMRLTSAPVALTQVT